MLKQIQPPFIILSQWDSTPDFQSPQKRVLIDPLYPFKNLVLYSFHHASQSGGLSPCAAASSKVRIQATSTDIATAVVVMLLAPDREDPASSSSEEEASSEDSASADLDTDVALYSSKNRRQSFPFTNRLCDCWSDSCHACRSPVLREPGGRALPSTTRDCRGTVLCNPRRPSFINSVCDC